MRGEPAEAAYFAAQPERPADQNSALLFLVQRANYADLSPGTAAIQDDLLNISAAVAKLNLIYAQADAKNGATRMAATEVEYILLVCRSLFDFIQEMSAKLWTRIQLLDPQVPKTQLKAKFSDMVFTSGKPRSSEEIAARSICPRSWPTPMPGKSRCFRTSAGFATTWSTGAMRLRPFSGAKPAS